MPIEPSEASSGDWLDVLLRAGIIDDPRQFEEGALLIEDHDDLEPVLIARFGKTDRDPVPRTSGPKDAGPGPGRAP